VQTVWFQKKFEHATILAKVVGLLAQHAIPRRRDRQTVKDALKALKNAVL
jgi:hypothetical protein